MFLEILFQNDDRKLMCIGGKPSQVLQQAKMIKANEAMIGG